MAAGNRLLAPYITDKGRDLRIDLLRGYFVVAMVIDHVRGASPLWLLTGGNRFFAGAAEGFILTSGLVAGLVYGRRIDRDGMGSSFMKVLGRALTLYLLTVGITLVLLPLSEMLYLPWAQGIDTRNPISVIVSILTLHRTYHLVDVLLLYTVLFLLTPIALLLLEQGKRWWVLGISWALWGLFQVWPDAAALPWPIAGNYLFSFAAWQVIFFTGLVLGYGRTALPVPKPRTARLLLIASGVLLAGLIALFFVVEPPATATPTAVVVASSAGRGVRVWVENLFLDKVDERVGRLFSAGVTFTFLFLAVTVFWKQVQRALGWLLMPLGQHALYAYTAHVALAAVVALVLAPLRLAGSGPQWLNGLIQAGSVALIWWLVRRQLLAPTPRTQRFYNLSPIFLAGLAAVAMALDPSPGYPGLAPADAGAKQAVSRFGTPLPPTATPAPTALPGSTAAPRPTATPVPTLTPEYQPANPAAALARVAPYMGPIDGRLTERWFYSAILGRNMPYWVYLPPDYDTASRRYPVLYMLHGLGAHRDEWIDYGLIDVADREMAHGTIKPMIIVLPQGDRSFWVNNVGGPRWGDYLVQDVVADVDGNYRTLREPDARAVGGLSMGGFGALTDAFTHQDVFGVVGAHSPSLLAEAGDMTFLGNGEEFFQLDPIVLAGVLPGLGQMRIWIDIATADPWLQRAEQLDGVLAARGIDHTFHVFTGGHDYEYWSTHVIDYVHFYADALAPRVSSARWLTPVPWAG